MKLGTVLFGMQEAWLAAKNGHLHVLQWLDARSRQSAAFHSVLLQSAHSLDSAFRCLLPAADGGHLPVVQ